MNKLIEFMRENYREYNGTSLEIGWYMCIPMTVIAETFGLSLVELGELTWDWRFEE